MISMPPLVSIVTPAYNAEKFIRRTIRSVQSQSFSDWEMIVVDDGSKDKTRQIVESFASKDQRIRLIKMPENSGLAAITRNRGLKEAKGEFIAFLDDDDIWHPRKLEIQLDYFEKNPTAQIIATYYKIFGDESRMKDWQGMLWRKPPGPIKPEPPRRVKAAVTDAMRPRTASSELARCPYPKPTQVVR